MGFKQTGYFNWSASGYSSIEEAKQEVRDILQKLPQFLLDCKVVQKVSIDLETDVISAEIHTNTYEKEYDI